MANYIVELTKEDYSTEVHEFDTYSDAVAFIDYIYDNGLIGYSNSPYLDSCFYSNVTEYVEPFDVVC